MQHLQAKCIYLHPFQMLAYAILQPLLQVSVYPYQRAHALHFEGLDILAAEP